MKILLIASTIDDENQAKKLANDLLDGGLAACVSIGAAQTSCYDWKGVRQLAKEYPILIKTLPQYRDKVVQFLQQNHGYDVPEIISHEANIDNPDYAHWFMKNGDKH